MRIGIPIEEDRGAESPVSAHFGRAPAFLIFDTANAAFQCVVNAHDHEEHGRCVPVDLIRHERLDAMVVTGIGRGALGRMAAMNLQVFRTAEPTAGAAIAALLAGALGAVGHDDVCAGHHHHEHGGNAPT
jgi:predicted Fe-Mo cluster-binding NifX family protein